MDSSSYPGQLNILHSSFILKSTVTVAMDLSSYSGLLNAVRRWRGLQLLEEYKVELTNKTQQMQWTRVTTLHK